jgi:TBC1 domain family member 15
MSITPFQESKNSSFRDLKCRIEKDVVRTDRGHDFFKDENSPYLTKLHNILLTYGFYNYDLGYCQGMGDLISPIVRNLY